MESFWLVNFIGGALIGSSASILLFGNGRVAGLSGIINGVLSPTRGEMPWRLSFVLGLLLGGFALRFTVPEVFGPSSASFRWLIVPAGWLVGFGTILGSGCTSGHGICGLSRFSRRSLVAVCVFMGAGFATVALLRLVGFLSI